MICPKCAQEGQLNDSVVLDSRRYYDRDNPANTWMTRRRRCTACMHRFTTYEGYKQPGQRTYLETYDDPVREDMA